MFAAGEKNIAGKFDSGKKILRLLAGVDFDILNKS